MAKRMLSHGYNRSSFSRNANRTKGINVYMPTIMRGGYRL